MKNYKLRTISEIVKVVTKDNIDVFISDFKEFLEFRNNLKDFSKEEGVELVVPDVFDWTDDGVKGCNGIRIEVTNKTL